ncbi:alpha/beta fold hydrolase [Pseudooceanicola aestuarii]|uniref:alpha/beta fold hydrolase n=1 Tax=Pseudooceanicola aestuarii TaxID=2697319 RepID=UPI0013D2C883|nr:alpha/beta fold hydrolase [Pseudooceanicola aestuarii]
MQDVELQTGGGHSWLEAGDGPPLVLIHGIGGTTANWRPVLAPLARGRRVLAWSFPGYDGAAPLPSASPAAADYALRLLDFLDQRDVGPAHMVGHSLGAVVVAALTQLAPDRASRLSLVCPVIGAGQLPPPVREEIRTARLTEIRDGGMAAFAEARTGAIVGPDATPGDLSRIIATMAGISASAYLQAWEMLCATYLPALLSPGTIPVQVMGCDADPVAPPDAVTALASHLSVEPVRLPGIGHFPTFEARDALIALVTGQE